MHQDPLWCGPESWVRRTEEGCAGAKGHLPLLSHTVALNSRALRVPNSNLTSPVTTKICFLSKRKEDTLFISWLAFITWKYLEV